MTKRPNNRNSPAQVPGIDCDGALELATEARLTSAESQQLAAHVDQCAACRAWLQLVQPGMEQLRIAAPSVCHSSSAVGAPQESMSARPPRYWTGTAGAVVSMAVLLLVMFLADRPIPVARSIPDGDRSVFSHQGTAATPTQEHLAWTGVTRFALGAPTEPDRRLAVPTLRATLNFTSVRMKIQDQPHLHAGRTCCFECHAQPWTDSTGVPPSVAWQAMHPACAQCHVMPLTGLDTGLSPPNA